MSKPGLFITLLVYFSFYLTISHAERTKDKMYENFNEAKGCYRRLNATHQIGCSSKYGGSTGVIHFCNSSADLDFIIANLTAGPYIPIIETAYFTTELVDKISNHSGLFSGLVLIRGQKPSSFSHDLQCPNLNSGLNGSCSAQAKTLWNPLGTGLLFRDIPFPVFYLESESDIETLKNCFEHFNNYELSDQKDRALCSLELSSFMHATSNSEVCQRRSHLSPYRNINPIKYCDPLGDFNVWSALFPLVQGPRNETKPINTFKYIIVSARLDTTSMFELTAGAGSPVTGLVSLLSTAQLLKRMLPQNKNYDRNVLFLLFNGESYDYIGSQRILHDMRLGNFPVDSEENQVMPVIRLEQIELYVEISQLGKRSLTAHYMSENKIISDFLKGISIPFKQRFGSLPPSSAHTFIKDNSIFPAVVLADHFDRYLNLYYNSIYDNASNIEYSYMNLTEAEFSKDNVQGFIGNVSEAIARALYQLIVSEEYEGGERVDVGLVDELIHCYLENPNCRVHKAIGSVRMPSKPLTLYVGVDNDDSRSDNVVTKLIALTLGWLLADKQGPSNINCTNKPKSYVYSYHNMSDSIYDLNSTSCYKMMINLTRAESPAFLTDDYDWSSGIYSTWTESTWGDMRMRMFLRPSKAHESMTIAVGSMTMIFSFILVYFVKSRSHILFVPPAPSVPPADC